jgi:hypothetical protein
MLQIMEQKNTPFIMFNFINRRFYVPGLSDLLLYNIIETAIKYKEYYLN